MRVKKNFRDKIVSRETFISICQEWNNKSIDFVFTNGCFDIIHKGHIDYLYEASLKGEFLVIGLNTDNSIRKIKGESRPIQDQKARAEVLSSLEFVDLVTLFDESTPENLIHSTNPTVLVKGDDYQISQISGSDFVISNGGRVETIQITSGYSTSKIVEKIKALVN